MIFNLTIRPFLVCRGLQFVSATASADAPCNRSSLNNETLGLRQIPQLRCLCAEVHQLRWRQDTKCDLSTSHNQIDSTQSTYSLERTRHIHATFRHL